MKVLEVLINNIVKKQIIIGQAKEFQTLEPTMKIIDPDLKGVVDYVTYSETDGNTGIPVIIPKTYHFEDISYSPTLTVEERKENIVKELEATGYPVDVLKWEEI